MREKLRGGLLSFILKTLIGAALGFGIGLIAQNQLPFLDPAVSTPLGISISWLGTAIWRARQKQFVNVSAWWVAWLSSLSWIGKTIAPIQWQWWAGPALGAGVGISLSIAWILLTRLLSQRTKQAPNPTKTGGQPRENPSEETTAFTQLRQKIAASLELPIGTGAALDIMDLVKNLELQAKSNIKKANAELLTAANEAIRLGVLKPEWLTDKACEMLEIQQPKPTISPPVVEISPKIPRWSGTSTIRSKKKVRF